MTKNLFDPSDKGDELDEGEALGGDPLAEGEPLEQEIPVQDIGSDIRSPEQTRRRRHDHIFSTWEERENRLMDDN